jgi:hypothetical protein
MGEEWWPVIISDYQLAHCIHRPRAKLFTHWGLFFVLAIVAVMIGAVLGFAT